MKVKAIFSCGFVHFFLESEVLCHSLCSSASSEQTVWRRTSASSLFSPVPASIVSNKAYRACASEWALTFGKCILGGTFWAELLLSPVTILHAFCHLLPSSSAWSHLLLDTSPHILEPINNYVFSRFAKNREFRVYLFLFPTALLYPRGVGEEKNDYLEESFNLCSCVPTASLI